MTSLNPLAVTAEPLLRALKATPDAKPKALAEASGRKPNNISRDLQALEEAGLISTFADGTRDLTEEAYAQLEALDRAAGPGDPSAAPVEGIVGLLHAQIRTSDRNPRRDWESLPAMEALDELAASIKAEGRVLQNLVVRPLGPIEDWNIETPWGVLPVYELVAGERRWRAVQRLIEAGAWPHDRPLPVMVVDLDDAGHDRVALIENLKRRDLNHMEEARAFRRLIDGGMTTAELAVAIGFTQRMVQQRLQLLDLSEDDQVRVERKELPLEKARNILAGKPEEGEPAEPAASQPAVVEVDLEPHQELALVEIEAAATLRPVTNPLGPTASFDDDFKLSEWPPEAELAAMGFIVIGTGHPRTVTLLRPAQTYLRRLIFAMAAPADRLRRARELAGLTDETIAELERDELFDRSWLNERNPPPKLAPADALLLLEIHDAAGPDSWRGAEIAAGTEDPLIDSLRMRNLVNSVREQNHRTYLPKAWKADSGLSRQFPGWEKKTKRWEYIRKLRADVDPTKLVNRKYFTDWLNGPFELPAKIQAQLDKEAAQRTEQEKRAEAQRQREQELAERKEAAVAQLEHDVAALDPATRMLRLADVLKLVGAPTPWEPHSYSYALAKAANGSEVTGRGLQGRLIRLAINIATGIDLASAGEPSKPADRPTFVSWIADRLQELRPEWKRERCQAQAGHALDHDLKRNDVEFGTGDYYWNEAEAHEIAEDWDANFDDDDDHPEAWTPVAETEEA